jgi:hypothetical protein
VDVEPPVLSVLDAASDDLAVLAETELDAGASLLEAIPGRALFAFPTALVVLDLDVPSSPRVRARFPSLAWIDHVRVDGRVALHAAGRHGIQSFDLDATTP